MRIHLLCLLCIAHCTAWAQTTEDTAVLPVDALTAYVDQVTTRMTTLDRDMQKSTRRILERLHRQEQRIAAKLCTSDADTSRFAIADYGRLSALLDHVNDSLQLPDMATYVPFLDTLATSFRFIQQQGIPVGAAQLEGAEASLRQFENRLRVGDNISAILEERVAAVTGQLQGLGLMRELQQLQQQVTAYRQTAASYKALLHDPGKRTEKALELLGRSAAFRQFMQRNSMLAQLFPIPAGYGTAQALAGLQTREGVTQLLQQRLGSLAAGAAANGVSPQQYMQQQLQAARAQLNEWQEKLNNATGGSPALQMPDYKPNSQRTKSFLQRVELGINLQHERSRYLLPVMSDIGISAGYKLHDGCVLGVGASYKMGWGNGWDELALTSEGVGIRSFIDLRAKGSFWLSGGWEYNYLQRFNDLSTIKNLDTWQKSGLLGVTKKYRIGSKEGKLQLLWDFMSYSQVPQGQAFRCRLGYTL